MATPLAWVVVLLHSSEERGSGISHHGPDTDYMLATIDHTAIWPASKNGMTYA
jgi:hypothetical protein